MVQSRLGMNRGGFLIANEAKFDAMCLFSAHIVKHAKQWVVER